MKEQEFYKPGKIESKWQQRWANDEIYNSDIDLDNPKHYALTMLPYPSGDLHIGHWYAMTPSDARARFKRMCGFNVMFPIGFDAFGLPAENAAINRGIHPKEWTYANIDRMRSQLRSMGAMFDWRREAISADPEYYRWSQWFFIQLLNHKKAYRKMSPVDWCPKCNTTLAREQVWGDDRHCERCETPVIKKDLDQWFFRTTEYADELLDFSKIDWPSRVRALQTNWIGRSEGAMVYFKTQDKDIIEVFTTRPDTLWGATFMVLAPEHPLVKKLTSDDQKSKVEQYVRDAVRQTEIQRESAEKDKTGVFTGGYAINPVNGQQIPIWIADYVLMTYGTGAIMAVPAHDERDFNFALKFGLPILPVIKNPIGIVKSYVPIKRVTEDFEGFLKENNINYDKSDDGFCISMDGDQAETFIVLSRRFINPLGWIELTGAIWIVIFPDEVQEWSSNEEGKKILHKCKLLDPALGDYHSLMEMFWAQEYYRDVLFHHEYGTMINSDQFSGTEGPNAVKSVVEWLELNDIGKFEINYRLRDWLISRQRYWGVPIPVIYCEDCGVVPLPEENLPVVLPDDVEWLPTGESPLKLHPSWKYTNCPSCDKIAERETDTLDTFMCSSWYHLRYLSPDFDIWPFDPEQYDYWMPVDTYTGGIEHATMHLIYTRYFHKAGRDMGIMKGDEPMTQLRNQGIILGEDSEKMSKSRGNVISPDALVDQYGADVVRSYLMFFARWELGAPWNGQGIEGTARWLKRVWALYVHDPDDGTDLKPLNIEGVRNLRRKVHQTVDKITQDFEKFEFNTIISSLMELLNEMYSYRSVHIVGEPAWVEALDIYLRLLAPIAPHIAEELWERRGNEFSIHQQPWPIVDKEALIEDTITLIVQINGKLRDRLLVPAGITADEAKQIALKSASVEKYLQGKQTQKVIYVPGRLVNIVA